MIVPGAILLIVYHYLPMLGFSMAFQNFKPTSGFLDSKWVGLDNFIYIMKLPNIYQVIWNTFYISIMKVVAGQVFPILVALLLNEIRIGFVKRGVQTLIYLPHFLSWIILGGILIEILSPSTGIVNQVIQAFGHQPVFFLGNANIFPYVLVVSDLWKEFGFSTIVYLAALTSINPQLYEAAVVDGATRLRQTWHITLPGMTPVVVLVATLSLGNILSAGFDQVFNLYNSSVYETGDIIDTLVYRMGIVQVKYSLATAIGLFKSVIGFLLIAVSYTLAYRLANYRIF
nr:ABC transporter permease subunit [Cohnella zeiphila]